MKSGRRAFDSLLTGLQSLLTDVRDADDAADRTGDATPEGIRDLIERVDLVLAAGDVDRARSMLRTFADKIAPKGDSER